jgi:hypothetical protein
LRRAYDTYAQAWKSLSEVNRTQPLEQPRLLAYRPSVSSVDRSQLDPAEAIEKTVELRFTVDRDGRIDNVTSPTTDVPENILRNSIASMKRARYAPRIENGVAMATQDVAFLEKVLIRAPTQEGSPSSASKEEKPAEQVPEAPPPAPEQKPE